MLHESSPVVAMVGWCRASIRFLFARIFPGGGRGSGLRTVADIHALLQRAELGGVPRFSAVSGQPAIPTAPARQGTRGRRSHRADAHRHPAAPLGAVDRVRHGSVGLDPHDPAAGARARYQELLGPAAVSDHRAREHLASGAYLDLRRPGPQLGGLGDAGPPAARRRALGLVLPGRPRLRHRILDHAGAAVLLSARRRRHVRARAALDSAR